MPMQHKCAYRKLGARWWYCFTSNIIVYGVSIVRN